MAGMKMMIDIKTILIFFYSMLLRRRKVVNKIKTRSHAIHSTLNLGQTDRSAATEELEMTKLWGTVVRNCIEIFILRPEIRNLIFIENVFTNFIFTEYLIEIEFSYYILIFKKIT